MQDFVPSKYQQVIFDFVAEGIGNAVVNAKAGSGKTTTAVRALEFIPKDKKVLFIAFNKDIVNEIKKRIGTAKNIKVTTFHALGYAMLMENLAGNVENIKYKYTPYIIKNISNLSYGYSEMFTNPAERDNYIRTIEKLSELARYNLAQSPEEISAIADKHGLSTEGDVVRIVKDVLEWGKTEVNKIDFTDMEWLPCELCMNTKRLKYDWIFIDEAQDASPVQQKLVEKCFKRNTRFVAIGDRNQSINGWAGADTEAFEKFQAKPNTQSFDLPVSFRCSKAVVKEAQEFVPDLQYRDGAPEGHVYHDVSPNYPKNGDMVLCRNTVPLTRLYMEYLDMGKKAYIRGNDIGEELIKKVESTKSPVLNVSLLSEGVMSSLWMGVLKTLSTIMKKHGLDISHAVETDEFTNAYTSVKTIEILSRGLTRSDDLKRRIANIFKNDGDGVCLSTVHKAKGLEAEDVYILCPSLMPSPKARLPWEMEAERNIQYVAVTRAKMNLYYIDEKKFSPEMGYASNSSILTNINTINAQIRALYKRDFLAGSGITEHIQNAVAPPTKRVSKDMQPKKIGANKFKNFMK